jgi:hypothetical protein
MKRRGRMNAWMTRGSLWGASVLLVGCWGDTLVVHGLLDTGSTTDVGATTTSTTEPMTTGLDSFGGSGQVPGSGEVGTTTNGVEPCEEVVCAPDEQCIGGVCFECTPTCASDCAEGETCQCPPDDLCCDVGSCVPSGCPPLDGNYAACIDAMGMTSNEPCDGATCVADYPDEPTAAVCLTSGCETTCQCPVAPATGDAEVACEDVTADGVNDCWLDCQDGSTCPDGMICFGDFICLFPVEMMPPPAYGYGDCANNPAITCQPGEDTCLTSPGGTAAACSQGGCMAAGDCPAALPTGDAPVACADLGGGNTCYLDCGGGQTCPDGMACTAVGGGMACLWPYEALLLDESFELGVLPPGWTVIDPQVAFVSEAWVVTDEFEPGMNFGAYSTSWYTPLGQADDWLITPQIMLGPASTLSWEAWAPDASYPDGYQVRISTGMPTVVDFMANASLFTIAHELDVFTSHAVDLAAAGYASQAVYLAFRNVSNDEFILVIDDVQITE